MTSWPPEKGPWDKAEFLNNDEGILCSLILKLQVDSDEPVIPCLFKAQFSVAGGKPSLSWYGFHHGLDTEMLRVYLQKVSRSIAVIQDALDDLQECAKEPGPVLQEIPPRMGEFFAEDLQSQEEVSSGEGEEEEEEEEEEEGEGEAFLRTEENPVLTVQDLERIRQAVHYMRVGKTAPCPVHGDFEYRDGKGKKYYVSQGSIRRTV